MALKILKCALGILIFSALAYPLSQDVFGYSCILAAILFFIALIVFSKE